MRKPVASFAIFLMVFAAILRGFVVPVVHAHEHMPFAPISANSDVGAVGSDCDPSSHADAAGSDVKAACEAAAHEHSSEKSKGHTAKVCAGNGSCCGVLLTLEASASGGLSKHTPESDRVVALTGVQPAGLDRPPSLHLA